MLSSISGSGLLLLSGAISIQYQTIETKKVGEVYLLYGNKRLTLCNLIYTAIVKFDLISSFKVSDNIPTKLHTSSAFLCFASLFQKCIKSELLFCSTSSLAIHLFSLHTNTAKKLFSNNCKKLSNFNSYVCVKLLLNSSASFWQNYILLPFT